MVTLILFSVIAILCWVTWSNHRQRNFPPGPKRFPLIGHLWSIFKLRRLSMHLRYDELLREHGPILGLELLGQKFVFIGDFALVKYAFSKASLSSRSSGYFMKVRSGKGLEPSFRPKGIFSGTLWKNHRTFFLKHMKNTEYGKSNFEISVHREINDLNEIFSSQHQSMLIINADTFAITTLNIIWEIIAGIRFSHTDPSINQMILNMRKIMKMLSKKALLWDFGWINRMFPKLTQIDSFVDLLESLKEMISCEIDKHKHNDINFGAPRDIIESFLQSSQHHDTNSEFYSDDELIMMCLDFFNAGYETTTPTLQWAILLMVLHPNIQNKVNKEIKKYVDDNELLTMAHTPMLPYTMAVLSEVLRFCSVVPLSLHHYATDNTAILDYVIPKGSIVFASLYTIHNNSEYWTDPQLFLPERFLNSDGTYKNNANLVPYCLGKRRCLGEDLAQSELFMIFGSLIRRFQFDLPVEQDEPSLERQEGVTCEPLPFKVFITDLTK